MDKYKKSTLDGIDPEEGNWEKKYYGPESYPMGMLDQRSKMTDKRWEIKGGDGEDRGEHVKLPTDQAGNALMDLYV